MHSVLAARSEFSIGSSILPIDKLVEGAKALGARSVALVDDMTVTGMIDFTNRAKKAELKPIIGCRLRLVDDPTWRRTKDDKKAPPEYYLTYYVLSEKGLKALFKLLSLANSPDRFYYTARLSFDDLYEGLQNIDAFGNPTLTADDVAIATSDMQSVITHPKAGEILGKISDILGSATGGGCGVFINLVPINTPYWDTFNKKAIDIGVKTRGVTPLVARPALYEKGDADAAEVMNAVTRNIKLSDMWVWSNAARDLHLLSDRDLIAACVETARRLTARDDKIKYGEMFKFGIANTEILVKRVNYTWSKAPVSLPVMAPDEFAALTAECKKGWAERMYTDAFGHQATPEELRDVYMPRLKYELGVIKALGFSGYFLLVQDIVQFAKKNGILVGPGRGSVGGSLIAYLMGITDCDPIRFGLLFERFINPDRIDLPDADLDFMSTRRHEIVEYLETKYGKERVAGISNFMALAAASTIGKVGKAFGLSEEETRCSKLAPKAHGVNIELKKAADMVPEIGAFRDKYRPLWDVCLKLEGVTNALGTHAAGVVVGGCDLIERAVLERRKDGATINWDKRIVEDQGLVKVDILGLETLDLIDLTLKYIRKRHTSARVDLMKIPLDDTKILENFAAGKTTGIFQFESGGMRRLLKELGKDGSITFDDITAATALYRPGPMDSGMMDSYYRRKQGIESIEIDHPSMADAVKPTYGVMVYQEQVMQVSRDLAGYSMADADKLRKIMGKKLPEEMKKERGKFVAGCVKTVGISEDQAGEIFDKIEKFAGYGFNKSHSVEYTLISYQAMWLKTYYPVEFYAAALSLMKEDKLPAILKDASNFGVEVLMPDINVSSATFEIMNDKTLCVPFPSMKGLTDNTANAILKAREAGPFTNKADFIARVDKRKCNAGQIEKLDAVGAFARIEPGQLPANHPDRIRDQKALIPGLVMSTVPVHRSMETDKLTKVKVIEVVAKYKTEQADDGAQVKPTFGKSARFVAIFDAPTGSEERIGSFSYGDNFHAIGSALSDAGLSRSDGYWTGLLKRPKEGKQITADEIKTYLPYLQEELALLKPPVIVLLGSGAVRQFFPDFKGKASDAAGKIVYSKDHDANFVIGFNPGEIFHDPDKQTNMDEVFASVAQLLD